MQDIKIISSIFISMKTNSIFIRICTVVHMYVYICGCVDIPMGCVDISEVYMCA